MKYRSFPRNKDIQVSEVGFGVWSVATKWWGVDDESLGISLLRHGLDNGINFFDTADVYGNGYGEEILQKAFLMDSNNYFSHSSLGLQKYK